MSVLAARELEPSTLGLRRWGPKPVLVAVLPRAGTLDRPPQPGRGLVPGRRVWVRAPLPSWPGWPTGGPSGPYGFFRSCYWTGCSLPLRRPRTLTAEGITQVRRPNARYLPEAARLPGPTGGSYRSLHRGEARGRRRTSESGG